MPATRHSFGVGSLVNGAEYYKALLGWYLSVDKTPNEIHQLGHNELNRILTQLTHVRQFVHYHNLRIPHALDQK